MIWKELGLIVFGTLIGLGATEFAARRREREDKIKENQRVTNEIITNVVNFISKAKDIITDIEMKKDLFLEMLASGSTHIEEEKKKFYKKMEEKLADFSIEMKFCSFQLKRLENQKIWKEFDALVEAFIKYYDIIPKVTIEDPHEKTEFERLYKIFINHCIKVSKINAP